MNAVDVPPPEFSRPVDVRQAEGKHMQLTANPQECAALARRFGLVRIERLAAELVLSRVENGAEGRGQLKAAIVQTCAVSGEDLPVKIDEPIFFRFVSAEGELRPDEEVEISLDDCDEIVTLLEHVDRRKGTAAGRRATQPFAVHDHRLSIGEEIV